MAGLSTYFHTARHLKLVQLCGRIRLRLAPRRIDASAPPALREPAARAWAAPARRSASLIAPGRWRFLNEIHGLDEHGWDDSALEKLWRYNQHYFDDLNAADAASRDAWHRTLLTRWVRENPPATGTGWEAYPTSLRIVNWIKWSLAGNELPSECVQSLAVQARWLATRLEFHLLGNHLLANAKALVFAGLFFEGAEADEWRERGLGILREEIGEQVLPDGGHFELSPMYHALVLEDMMDLCNLGRTFPAAVAQRDVERWHETIGRMRTWLAAMCHPDGEIAFFNDATMGIAPAPLELERYARSLGFAPQAACPPGATALESSGYVRISAGAAVVLLDAAAIGPDYLPAHGHADTLSFELSLFGHRVLVNSGVSCYGDSAERLRQRGTAAHNTVVVDGENSSEVWGGFRVARRARPAPVEVERGDGLGVRCAHDGYERLRGSPTHIRTWRLHAHALVVEDVVSGAFERAQARFHLHPGIAIDDAASDLAGGRVALRLPEARRCVFSVEGCATLRAEPATWHPEFGASEPNVCLVADFAGPRISSCVDWADSL